jgi:O-antigen ligase
MLKRLNPSHFDKVCLILAAMVPTGIVIGNAAFETMIGLIGIVWLGRCFQSRTNPLPRLLAQEHPLVIPWIVWFAAILLSLLYNGAGSKGGLHDLAFIRYLIFALALADIALRRDISRYLIGGLALAVGWAAVSILTAYLTGTDLLGKPLFRYTGKLKEAARIAGLTAYAAPFFLTWGVTDHNLNARHKSLIIGIGLIALFIVLQTHVRTAVLAVSGSLLFIIARHIPRRYLKIAIPGVCGIMLIGGLLFFQETYQWDLRTVYDRFYYWKVTAMIWLNHPVLGIGVSSFQDAYREMALSGIVSGFIAPDGEVFQLAEVCHAHNLFLMLLACTGLFGFAVFAWLLVSAIRPLINNCDGWRVGLISWPIVLLLIGLTGFNIFHSWYHALWTYLMILAYVAGDCRKFQIRKGAKECLT